MNWAIKRVKVPEAWKEYKENLKHNIRVGIIDSRIYNNHPDLKIPNSNISNGNHKIDSHGTRVMGIIAAVWNNEIGLSGITDFDRENYYAYSLPINGNINISTISILRGLEWNVIRGVKVINVSVGNNSIEDETPTELRDRKSVV